MLEFENFKISKNSTSCWELQRRSNIWRKLNVMEDEKWSEGRGISVSGGVNIRKSTDAERVRWNKI